MRYVVKKATTFLFFVSVLLSPYILSFAQQTAPTTKENATQFLYGIASWYGDGFEGKTTASGEVYSSLGMSAGHRSLPFGTRIEVENLSNSKKAEFIINDRGPFEQNRLINLSKQGAEVLGFLSDGTTFVKITVLELGTSLPTPLSMSQPIIGSDIPQNFQKPETTEATVDDEVDKEIASNNADTTSYNEEGNNDNMAESVFPQDDPTVEDLLNEENLFADLDEEFEYMDDSFDPELTRDSSALKAQGIPNDSYGYGNPKEGINPTGFDSSEQDIIIDDPLSNIVIGPEDEFVIAPSISEEALRSVPYPITPEEQRMLRKNATDDPFSDLFNDTSDPYSFQEEVARSSTSPGIPGNTAPNIKEDDFGTELSNDPFEYPTYEYGNDESGNGYVQVIDPYDNSNDNFGVDNIPTNTYTLPTEPPVTPQMIEPTPQQTKETEMPTPPIPQERAPVMPPSPPPVEEIPQILKKAEPPIQQEDTQNLEEGFAPQKMEDHYIIQLGAFSKQKNALDLYEQLRKAGFNTYITDVKIKGQNLMRVRVGYFSTIDKAIQISQQLSGVLNLENRIIKVDIEKP